MMMQALTRSLPLAAAAAMLAPAAAGAATYDRDVRTAVVRIADLDLASGWGVDRTIGRLRSAIDDMCGDDEACRDQVWLSADWQVARRMADAQWRRRIVEERMSDRTRFGWDAPPPEPADWAPPPPPPPAPDRAPPPPAVASVTTTTTTTTVTTITLAYRTPPPDYGWYPH